MTWLLEAGPFSARNGEGRVLFSDVSVRLRAECLTLLEGASGSGKTTLLRQLVGLEEAGSDRVLDGDSYGPAQLPRWRARVTLLAQDAPMIPGTVEDNLKLPFCMSHDRDCVVERERMAHLQAAAGLGEIPLERDISTLSGGERHRLALVRGLLWDPPVLVADEPLSGLDPERAEDCFSLLLEQARRPDRAVLCVLHDPGIGARADARLVLSEAALRYESGGQG
jgi:ABC-type iron transport system FetAB ATPase subunit